MKTSIIICTRNREDSLRTTIYSVNAQSTLPDELIVVDASDRIIEHTFFNSDDFKYAFYYFHVDPGLTRQRNYAIGKSSGDLLLFIDDDVVLDQDYVKWVKYTFEHDTSKLIGALLGKIINIGFTTEDEFRAKNNLRFFVSHLLSKIFLLSGIGNGKIKLSGFPSHPHKSGNTRFVECLSGCCMSFRKELFKDICFDASFVNYSYMEDVDISIKVLQADYKIVYEPNAKLVHRVEKKGRSSNYQVAYMLVKNSYYLFKKYWSNSLLRKIAFSWSMLGLLILSVCSLQPSKVKGTADGIKQILYKDI